MTQRILALDPGGTTGWAMWTDKPGELLPQFSSGHIGGGEDEHHLQLHNLLGSMQVEDYTVVTERFDYRNDSRAGLNLMSREYIGVAKLFAQDRMDRLGQRLVLQSASQAKGFVKDEHIKRLALWSPGHKHAMDAMRHLIYFAVNDPQWKESNLRKWILERGYR